FRRRRERRPRALASEDETGRSAWGTRLRQPSISGSGKGGGCALRAEIQGATRAADGVVDSHPLADRHGLAIPLRLHHASTARLAIGSGDRSPCAQSVSVRRPTESSSASFPTPPARATRGSHGAGRVVGRLTRRDLYASWFFLFDRCMHLRRAPKRRTTPKDPPSPTSLARPPPA